MTRWIRSGEIKKIPPLGMNVKGPTPVRPVNVMSTETTEALIISMVPPSVQPTQGFVCPCSNVAEVSGGSGAPPRFQCYRLRCQLGRSSLEIFEAITLLWTALALAYGVIALAVMIGRWALLNRPGTGQDRTGPNVGCRISGRQFLHIGAGLDPSRACLINCAGAGLLAPTRTALVSHYRPTSFVQKMH
jgi:hypothetical protein